MSSDVSPTYEELLGLLQKGPECVPLIVDGFIDLSKPQSLYRFREELIIPFLGDLYKLKRDKGVKITLHDYTTGRELHTIVGGDIEELAQRIERTVFHLRPLQAKPEYLPYFVVMYEAFTRGNLRGEKFNDLLNQIAQLYADHNYRVYEKDHLRARRRIKKWLRDRLGRIFHCDPKQLQDHPPWDSSTNWID